MNGRSIGISALAFALVSASAFAGDHCVRAGERAGHVATTALADVASYAALQFRGDVTAASRAAPQSPRYDVDVRVADGRTAHVTIDAATREIAWRSPPVTLR